MNWVTVSPPWLPRVLRTLAVRLFWLASEIDLRSARFQVKPLTHGAVIQKSIKPPPPTRSYIIPCVLRDGRAGWHCQGDTDQILDLLRLKDREEA